VEEGGRLVGIAADYSAYAAVRSTTGKMCRSGTRLKSG
jgi:hypothetical protein